MTEFGINFIEQVCPFAGYKQWQLTSQRNNFLVLGQIKWSHLKLEYIFTSSAASEVTANQLQIIAEFLTSATETQRNRNDANRFNSVHRSNCNMVSAAMAGR